MEDRKIVHYKDADVRFLRDENSQYISLSNASDFLTRCWALIVGFLLASTIFMWQFDILVFKSKGELITIFFSGTMVLISGYFLCLIPYILYNSYFFRNGYIVQNQEKLVLLYKPYNRFLDKEGKYHKVIQRADITQFIINGSFGDICAVKEDKKVSIISNDNKIDYSVEDGWIVSTTYIGMEEPLAEKICFKLNEFWGFDTTPPIADEQKNELKAD